MKNSIIIFTDSFPYGNAENFLEAEINYFCRYFDRVTVIPLQGAKGESHRSVPESVNLVDSPFRNLKNRAELLYKGIFNTSYFRKFLSEAIRSQVWKAPAKLRIWFAHFLMIRAILSFIRKNDLLKLFNDSDLLFFNWGLRWSQVIPFLPRNLKPEIAVRFHGSDLYEHLNSGYIPWRKEQIERAGLNITVSEAGRTYFSSMYGIPEGKIFLSRIGTPDYGLNPYSKTGTVRIVSCSNIVNVKRVHLIVEILKFLKISAEWIHFGGGPMKGTVYKKALSLPVNITWQMTGEIKHAEVIDFFRNVSVDLFINVSSSEGVPVSVMEALSFGIPVIATDAGGTAEIVSEENGMIFPVEFNPEKVARAIEKLYGSGRYEKMREAARRTWEEKCREDRLIPVLMEKLKNL